MTIKELLIYIFYTICKAEAIVCLFVVAFIGNNWSDSIFFVLLKIGLFVDGLRILKIWLLLLDDDCIKIILSKD